jgi:uncharacterized protein (TIGR03663 family)
LRFAVDRMPAKNISLIYAILIFIIALSLRLPYLSEKPMHGDEAVNAIKYSKLLETGKFEYDPTEYHGPTLYYFTLPVSWLSGINNLKELNETALRIIPVIFGIGLILLFFLLKPVFGWTIPLTAALLTAISSAFVYYSRYYIHEMLLVFFCYLFIIAGYRYLQTRKFAWLITSAFSMGLLISTKETWILICFALLLSFIIIFISNKRRHNLTWFLESTSKHHIAGYLIVSVLTIIVLYSAFFTFFEGLQNVFSAFSVYVDRAGHSEIHNHPWYMYFKWLLFFNSQGGSLWSEGIIALLALIGIFSILHKKHWDETNKTFLQFTAAFVLVMMVVFSVIPYKTPWNFLTFWYGCIFFGAVGLKFILNLIKKNSIRQIFYLVFSITIIHLGWQSYQLSFKHSSDTGNPYVYAHPGGDVINIANKLEQLAMHHEEGYQLHIEVIAKNSDYWPLPWYLRNFDKIGWWEKIDLQTEAAPIVIIQPELVDSLIYKLYEMPLPGQRHLYIPLFDGYTELRPGIEFQGYIRKDFWDILYQLDTPVQNSQ